MQYTDELITSFRCDVIGLLNQLIDRVKAFAPSTKEEKEDLMANFSNYSYAVNDLRKMVTRILVDHLSFSHAEKLLLADWFLRDDIAAFEKRADNFTKLLDSSDFSPEYKRKEVDFLEQHGCFIDKNR